MGRKFGGPPPPFGEGATGSPSNTMSPGPRPSVIPSDILIHEAIWPQQIWAEKWGGGCAPLGEVGAGPHLIQSRLGRDLPPYQVTSWSMKPFGRNRYGPKIGEGVVPLSGRELGPHLTQCSQGQGLPACQVSSWSVQPFGHSVRTSQTEQTGQDRTGQERTDRQTADR